MTGTTGHPAARAGGEQHNNHIAMKRQTKIDMTILYYEEANTLDYKGRGKPWTWKDDDMENFREGIEAATDAHVDRLFTHWKARANPTARRALDKEFEKFQAATAPYWGDIGPSGALS